MKELTSLTSQLERLQNTQLEFFENDPIRQELEDLFCGKIGQPPKDQTELEEIFNVGEIRYKKKIPPGYLDQAKDRSGECEEFVSGGLIYKKNMEI